MIKNLAYIGARAAYKSFLIAHYSFKSISLSQLSTAGEVILVELPKEAVEVVKTKVIIKHVGNIHVWYYPSNLDLDEETGDAYTLSISEYRKTWFFLKEQDTE